MVPTEPPDNQDGDRTIDGAADEENEDSSLNRTGKLFGGLVADIKRKAPWYLSDFKDGIHVQCLASAFFMYFGCLVPMVLFGRLMGMITDDNIDAFECLVGGAVCGVTYHLFSGQPLTILSPSGSVLIFEIIVFRFCMQFGWYYLGFRFWIGIWISVIFLIFVAFDLSFLVRYITRFTEESVAAAIAFVFIHGAFLKQFKESDISYEDTTGTYNLTGELPATYNTRECLLSGGQLITDGCQGQILDQDSKLCSIFVFLGTFLLSLLLKLFKEARFLPFLVRSCISDFAVVASVFLMVLIDSAFGLRTAKLKVPQNFQPTRPDRGWIIDPFGGDRNPWFTVFAAFPPGLFAAILMLMDQHISTVIITRKDKKLKKGSGFHLDLLVVAVQVAVCSAFGVPWFVGATILSINHVNSLTVETETSAPAERSAFLGIREQRVTGILVFVMVGLSVFFAQVLKFVPLPVLHGVFVYMGIACFKDMQFIDRLRLLFLSKMCWGKNYAFMQKVEMKRVHLFTFYQMLLVIALLFIKEIQLITMLFPLSVVAMCAIRKKLGNKFTYEDLLYLDDILPGSKRSRTENSTGTDNTGGLELQTEAACVISEAPNDVMLSESTGVAEDLVPDALPPAYNTVVHHSDGMEHLLPDAMPPSYNTIVHLSDMKDEAQQREEWRRRTFEPA